MNILKKRIPKNYLSKSATINNVGGWVKTSLKLATFFCRITKWGSTYNIYSFLRVWIVFDGTFVNVVPAPSVKGQHCGLCGNYNRDRYDEMMARDGQTILPSVDALVADYKWKC